jgi:carbonic anhydrase/acetyltransferase-like protein (isoleucine patch superfamily)
MALIKSVRGFKPLFGADCYLAETAVVIGDVVMGDQCSVWFNAVVRGDVNSIRIGNKVNIQDGAVIHCTYQTAPTTIGNRVSIGHNASGARMHFARQRVGGHGFDCDGPCGGAFGKYNCRRCRGVGEDGG